MIDLRTKFAGLELENPIIVSSSGLTTTPEKIKKLAEAGAGAVVLKSLFEEQILIETSKMLEETVDSYGEGSDYLKAYVQQHKLAEYLTLIKESKAICDIPVIASINCYNDAEWVSFAKSIEDAGADALEINILAHQTDLEYAYGSFEQSHIEILKHIKKTVGIPVVMKLGNNFTNPIKLIDQLYANGADGVVLFNRFYQPDIDIEKMIHSSGPVLSHSSEFSNTLRWVGFAAGANNKVNIAASGGIHNPEEVVKMLLAGATAVQLCSVIYKKSNKHIMETLNFLIAWMKKKGFENIAQFQGKLSTKDTRGINYFERTQFLKYFTSQK